MNKLYILSDGKPGHVNQSLGIAQYLQDYQLEIISVKSKIEVKQWFKSQLQLKKNNTKTGGNQPLVIGAGSKTQLWLIAAKYILGYQTVVLMKPKYPACFFDICFIPEHDYKQINEARLPNNIHLTRGAPNLISYQQSKQVDTLLILVGGASKAYAFCEESLIEKIKTLIKNSSCKQIKLTTSRRTPTNFLDNINKLQLDIKLIDGRKTKTEWLPKELSQTEQVWVTEDSVSMVYEALSSGTRVGILPMPKIKKANKIALGIEKLINQLYVTSYTDYEKNSIMVDSPEILQEAKRCAMLINKNL